MTNTDWIPVKERLPEVYDRYLVSFTDESGIPCKVDICNYGVMVLEDDGKPHWYFAYSELDINMDDAVEAWAEIPDPL